MEGAAGKREETCGCVVCVCVSWGECVIAFGRMTGESVCEACPIRPTAQPQPNQLITQPTNEQAATWEGVVEAMERARHPLEYSWGVRTYS